MHLYTLSLAQAAAIPPCPLQNRGAITNTTNSSFPTNIVFSYVGMS